MGYLLYACDASCGVADAFTTCVRFLMRETLFEGLGVEDGQGLMRLGGLRLLAVIATTATACCGGGFDGWVGDDSPATGVVPYNTGGFRLTVLKRCCVFSGAGVVGVLLRYRLQAH